MKPKTPSQAANTRFASPNSTKLWGLSINIKKHILLTNKSEYGWKTVGEYLDNEIADKDEDAKKMKKAEKEAQRKLAENRAAKAAKARSWQFKARSVANTSTSQILQSPFALQPGSGTPRFPPSVTGGTRHLLLHLGSFVSGPTQKRGTCFGCGKPGHWRHECPLLVVAQAQPEGKKLSNNSIDLCYSESVSESNVHFENSHEIDNIPVGKGYFLEWECARDSVRRRLRRHISAWKEIKPTEAVLSVVKEGYKLPLLTIPESRILRNNNFCLR